MIYGDRNGPYTKGSVAVGHESRRRQMVDDDNDVLRLIALVIKSSHVTM